MPLLKCSNYSPWRFFQICASRQFVSTCRRGRFGGVRSASRLLKCFRFFPLSSARAALAADWQLMWGHYQQFVTQFLFVIAKLFTHLALLPEIRIHVQRARVKIHEMSSRPRVTPEYYILGPSEGRVVFVSVPTAQTSKSATSITTPGAQTCRIPILHCWNDVRLKGYYSADWHKLFNDQVECTL